MRIDIITVLPEMIEGFFNYFISTLFALLICCGASAQKPCFELVAGTPVTIAYDIAVEDMATTNALRLLSGDINAVLLEKPEITTGYKGHIWAGTIGKSPLIQKLIDESLISIAELDRKKESFMMSVVMMNKKPTLVVAGSDSHGTAYGLLEISRRMGVSPWEWWADVKPDPLERFILDADFKTVQSPSVAYRGIFLNDEDWGLLPWSNKTYEPTDVRGQIGPKTYECIFQLLLRLRANTIWPAMHECTVPFFLTEGNREMAEQYGIYVGSSHCEPLACNAAGEWDKRGAGDYNYLTNRENVLSFWTERLKKLRDSNNIFTIGMRGKHDGMMQGVKTQEEHKNALSRIIPEQRELLKQYINPDIESIPQVFIPYKEVLDVYNSGLEIPKDITLMWCDDNYGYIRHFPTEDELKRAGGNGIYYHVSYWGSPHDYLWLGTASPGLLYQQMKTAYEKGIREMWILNAGDIKPCEYQTELFLDLAWDFDGVTAAGISRHLKEYLQREFGDKTGGELLPIMQEYYRLAYIRKPEFMGNTREYERTDPASRIVKDLPWSEKEIRERLQSYKNISDEAKRIGRTIPAGRQDAYFELIEYPLQAAAQMNNKMLTAQLARHGKAAWENCDAAYDSIVALTTKYNALANGKWNRMMDHRPRRLPPFERMKRESATTPLPEYKKPLCAFNGTAYSNTTTEQYTVEGLGYENKTLSLRQGSLVSFQLNNLSADSIAVEIRLLPNHPVNSDKLRFGIALDDAGMKEIVYQSRVGSEEWKQNVLRNQAIRRITLPVGRESPVLNIKAIDEGIVLDQVLVYDGKQNGIK
jgi:hypothetical protein